MKKVLIVEDSLYRQSTWCRSLTGKVIILSAFCRKVAEQMFAENTDIDIVVMDGCVDSDEDIDTESLVRMFRETFRGPMIAASKSPHFRSLLKEAGCNYECHKEDVPKTILKILKI